MTIDHLKFDSVTETYISMTTTSGEDTIVTKNAQSVTIPPQNNRIVTKPDVSVTKPPYRHKKKQAPLKVMPASSIVIRD